MAASLFWLPTGACFAQATFASLNYIHTVIRPVVSPATTALKLFSRGRASTGDLGAHKGGAPGRVSTVTLRMSEALSALALRWAFWRQIRFHRQLQATEFGE